MRVTPPAAMTSPPDEEAEVFRRELKQSEGDSFVLRRILRALGCLGLLLIINHPRDIIGLGGALLIAGAFITLAKLKS